MGVKRLTAVGGSKWRQVFVTSGLTRSKSALCFVFCTCYSHPCLCLSSDKKWWSSALLPVASTEPPLDSWHVASLGLIFQIAPSYGTSLSVTQVAGSLAAQRQWHYWGGTLTSLRGNTDLPEVRQWPCGRFCQQPSNQGNETGLMSVQGQLADVGQGGQLRTGLSSDIAQAAACGDMETPKHFRRANEGQPGPVRPVGVPRVPAAVWPAWLGTWAWVLDCGGGWKGKIVCDLIYCWPKFSFYIIWSQVLDSKSAGEWGENKALWKQMLSPCWTLPDRWCLPNSAFWSSKPSLPGELAPAFAW